MNSRLSQFVLVLGLMLSHGAWAGHFDIVYAKYSDKPDPREGLPLAALDLAMKKTGSTYSVKPADVKMERQRSIVELARVDHKITLAWTSMSAEAEGLLRPVRIPIFRGLIGNRLLLIHKDRQADFDSVQSIDDLRRFSIGQGLGWIDIKILESVGMKVETAPYDDMFKLVDKKKVDAFARGALEVVAEVNSRKEEAPNLVIEDKLLIAYRSDLFFYTNRADEELASTIERGLLKAYEDGSYLKLFREHPYVRDALSQVRLEKRRRFEIPNPFLSEEDRLIPARFWEK